MKLSDQHKAIKSEINEQLANSVKNLQQEISSRTDGQYHIQSDSTNSQQFLSVLEAAFVHGLKATYYEKKHRSKDLPKPQFWNLVNKISHKDTLNRAKSLKLIRSNIGLCRAWLRLAVNDAALTSYLSSLLSSSEHKSILTRYYEAFALFRDSEQADIFLRYLQGAENLEFDLASNSSVLNSWVRTPLELSGIITPTSAAKKPLQDNNNYVQSPTPSNVHRLSSPWQQKRLGLLDHRGSLSSGSSQRESPNTPRSISPDGSVSSEGAVSLPAINTAISADDELVEVDPLVGTAPSRSPPPMPDGSRPRLQGSVLHSRHLKKRKRNIRRNQSLDFASSGSTFGSMSSICSNVSAQSCSVKGESPSRTSSISSENQTTSNSSDNQDNAEESNGRTKSNGADTGTVPNWRRHSTPVLGGEKHRHMSRHHRRKVVKNIVPLEERRSLEAEEVEKWMATHDEVDESSSSTLNLAMSDGKSPPPSDLPSPTQFLLDVGNPTNQAESRDFANHDASPTETEGRNVANSLDDIYAQRPTSPLHVEDQTEKPQSYLHMPCTPISPGNSLLCGVGWTSEPQPDQMASPVGTSPEPITEEPVVKKETHPKVAITKEGYLQKKGETLLFWRSRWFVLDGETLSYYKDKNMLEKLGQISLRHVTRIKDDEVKKNKSISLIMSDGVHHQLAAESQQLIRDWLRDLQKVIEAAAAAAQNAEASNREHDISDYEVLEGNGQQEHLLGDDVSGSWYGSMMNHMTRIANEQGLDLQSFQCADCASPIGIIYGSPRVCSFTGQYYCPQCHLNEDHVIPARMLHNWDFRKHKVAKRSKRFLSQIWREPCIEMDKANPAAYRHLAQMKRLLPLRRKLSALQPYLLTCSKLNPATRSNKLQGHSYMLGNPHLYSAFDLQKSQTGDLCDVIEKMVTWGVEHVRSCPLCQARGFLCEICGRDEVIFAFDEVTTAQCDDCKSVYHKDCLKEPSACPKCLRRNDRMKRQENDVTLSDDDK